MLLPSSNRVFLIKPFQFFLVIQHLSEVSTLSGQGIYPYLFHYRTAFAFSELLYPLICRHSLRSAFHVSLRLHGDNRAYHVPLILPNDLGFSYPPREL